MAKRAVVLRKIRDRLAVPERWCKGAMARDSDGIALFPVGSWQETVASREAVSHCLTGVVFLVAPEMFAREQSSVTGFVIPTEKYRLGEMTCLSQAIGRRGYLDDRGRPDSVTFNNATTHADVLAVLDEAIAAYEGMS